MLTTRGWWFLILVLAMLALGLFGVHPVLGILALVLFLWFLAEWFLFAVRSRIVVRNVTVHRIVGEGGGGSTTLWAGQTISVRVEILLEGWLGLPYVAVADWVPFGIEAVKGVTQAGGALRSQQPLHLQYQMRCRAAGKMRFEGVQLQLADLQGFFFHRTFVPDVTVYRVLPTPVNAEGQPATTKRHNLLPPPGIHRLRRPGSGSELLDLRDYRPGDPPKTIAWKVSARRDRLITKEFESEVPVRCTLFLDTSHSVRIGPAGQNALEGLVEIAAAVAQANAANRDLTGLCLFEERTVQIVRPARGARHLAKLLSHLVDAASLAPATGKASVDELMQLAYPLAQEVYPYLMHSEINRVPFWLPWLWPLPAESRRPPSLLRQLYATLFVCAAAVGLLVSVLLYYVGVDLSQETLPPSWRASPLLIDLAALAGVALTIPFLVVVYRALPLLLAFRRRRLARWRKKLAAVLASLYGLGPTGLARLLEDDEQFSLRLQHFLADHQVPYTLPLYDATGHYLFACPAKVDVLARALLQAVGKGHDNELFVLMVDLLEIPEQLDLLLRSVRVALARHHQVVVVCPWPAGLAVPDREGQGTETEAERPTDRSARADVRSRRPSHPATLSLAHLLKRATTRRFQNAFEHLRRAFGRLGVPVIWAEGQEPVQMILDRMERLRGLGRKR